MNGLLLDTSAVYAAADAREDWHAACRAEYEQALRARTPMVTTELVLAELHALAIRRAGPEAALAIADRLAGANQIEIVTAGSDRIAAALKLLRTRPGRLYSLADAVSFVVMRERGITRAFTLDTDFAAGGFEVVPAG